MQAPHSTPLGRRFVLNCRIIPSRPHSQRRWALISQGGRGADLHFLPFSRSAPNTCTGWASLGGRVPPGGGAQSLHRTVGLQPFMSRQPTRLLVQSFSTYPARETGFQWPPSVGYCYPFRGKFPAQGSIIIPINDDIIHAAKICMLPAKTFP